MKHKLWLIVTAVIVIAAVVAVSGGSDTGSQGKEVIKIGYIAPLSGNAAYLGEGVKNAAELALADLSKKDTRYEYQLVFEDDGFNPVKSATAAQKLISVDGADVIVSIASSAGNAVNPIAEQAKVVHMAIAGDQNIARGEYNFINWTPPVEEVKTFLAEAERRGIRTLSVFTQNMPGTIAVVDELERQIKGTDMRVVFKDVSNFGTKDFRTAIRKSIAAKPDYVMFMMFSPELELVIGQMKELGDKTPITAIESFELSDNPAAFEGQWYVNAADPTADFSARYQSAYGKNPSVATPNAYDIVGLVATAAESFKGEGKPSAQDIARALHAIRDYDGALGENQAIDADGLVISKAVVRMIKGGQPVTIGK